MQAMIGNSGRYIRFVFLSLCFVTIFSANAWAGFTKIDTELMGILSGSAAWGDYDNDGDLDMFVIGETEMGTSGYIGRNDGNDVFTPVDGGPWGFFHCYELKFGDYDNDGDLDSLVYGQNGPKSGTCDIWRNDGGRFTKINTGFTSVVLPSADWGDYDNDGDLDVLLTGGELWDVGMFTELWRNDGNDSFIKIDTGLPETSMGIVAWGDYDNDGDLDIFLSGFYVVGSGYAADVFRNDGNDTFTPINAGLMGREHGEAYWVDYDNDGDLDILMAEHINITSRGIDIYRNDGNDNFTNIPISISYGDMANVDWGDFDNDGDLDLLVCADNLINIWRNDGNDTFTKIDSGLTLSHPAATAAWGDYDNDGDLDIILTGRDSISATDIWRNDGGWDGFVPNTPPTAPTNLQHNENAGRHILFWDPSFDNQTPVAGLSYNIWIGTSPDKMDILSPMSDGTTGWRKVPAMGNTGPNPFFMFDGPMPSGTAYYWQVQAVDTAFAGSEWSELSWFGDSETLVVKKNGNGSGTVTSDLAGIDCGGECWSEFPINGTITLTAVADAHSEFIGWCGGDCHGTETCTVTMDQSRTVLATFIKKGPGWWGGWHHRPHYWQWLNWWRHHWTRPWNHHYVWWGGWRRHLPH